MTLPCAHVGFGYLFSFCALNYLNKLIPNIRQMTRTKFMWRLLLTVVLLLFMTCWRGGHRALVSVFRWEGCVFFTFSSRCEVYLAGVTLGSRLSSVCSIHARAYTASEGELRRCSCLKLCSTFSNHVLFNGPVLATEAARPGWKRVCWALWFKTCVETFDLAWRSWFCVCVCSWIPIVQDFVDYSLSRWRTFCEKRRSSDKSTVFRCTYCFSINQS